MSGHFTLFDFTASGKTFLAYKRSTLPAPKRQWQIFWAKLSMDSAFKGPARHKRLCPYVMLAIYG